MGQRAGRRGGGESRPGVDTKPEACAPERELSNYPRAPVAAGLFWHSSQFLKHYKRIRKQACIVEIVGSQRGYLARPTTKAKRVW